MANTSFWTPRVAGIEGGIFETWVLFKFRDRDFDAMTRYLKIWRLFESNLYV